MTFSEFYKEHASEIDRKYDGSGKEKLSMIYEVLGNLDLTDVLPMHIMEINSRLLASSSIKTTEKYYGFIKRVFLYAENEGLIKDNPTRDIKLPKVQRTVRNTKITEAQRKEVLVLIEASPLKAMLQLISVAGVGCNKVRCLCWDDIDFTKDVLSVKYAVPDRSVKVESRSLLPLKKQRNIHIPSFIMKSLMELYELQAEGIRISQPFPGLHRPIFMNTNGEMYSSITINREIKKIGKAVGVDGLTCTDMVKDSIYQAVAMGVPIRDIMTFYNLGDGNMIIAQMYRELRSQKKIGEQDADNE